MDRYSSLIVFCAIFVVLLHCGAAQNVHIVGDAMGWIIPLDSSGYTNWTSGKTFMVGDILVFNFFPGRHDVLQVPQASYNACTRENAIGPIFTAAPTNITLNSTGDHYYICTFGSHCQSGQKLAINVSSVANPPAASPPSTRATPTPAPTQSVAGGPSAAMTPSPETPTTPETPPPASTQPGAGGPAAAMTPSPTTPTTPETPSPTSTQPGAGGPSAAMTPPPPPGSASTSLAAGFLLTLLSAVIAMIF